MVNQPHQAVAHEASRITRRRARSFYLASLFLPSSVRHDTHSLYAFYRVVDDLADDALPQVTRDERRTTLVGWKASLCGGPMSPNMHVAAAFDLARRHDIPPEYLCMVIDGALLDLDLQVIHTREELYRYSRLVAGSVGMVMCHLFGTRDEDSLQAASALGVAMQITNVLRDVGEDLRRGRVYLPQADLEACGYSSGGLYAGRVDAAFCAVIRSLSADARIHYQTGMRGIPRLDPAVQFSVYLAATLYARILDDIESHGFNVFTRRASLGATEKWMLTMPTYLHHRQALRRQT